MPAPPAPAPGVLVLADTDDRFAGEIEPVRVGVDAARREAVAAAGVPNVEAARGRRDEVGSVG